MTVRTAIALGSLTLAAITLAACATPTATAPEDDHGHEPAPASTASSTASPTATPRLTISYDGGVMVIDAYDLTLNADIAEPGFLRLNPAGDGRHVLVSAVGGFKVLDTGAWSEPHGDHAHHYVTEPTMTDVMYAAEHPGHAIVHDGTLALYDDANSTATMIPTESLTTVPVDATTYTAPTPHHGFAIPLNGGLITTSGTEDSRDGIIVLDADGHTIAENHDCPGVHGEAMAADAITAGCENGILIYRDNAIVKIDSPDAYGRIGNQAGSPNSSIVLGDYKSDPTAELERPTRISLIDTATATLTLVDLPSSYSFRSLGRGPVGEALVLGTDGALHIIDPQSAAITTSVPVVAPWTEPDDWQLPRPAIFVSDDLAYVTEPATNQIHIVDLETFAVIDSASLPHTPNEITGVAG